MGTTKKFIVSFLLCALAFVTVGCSCSKATNVEQVIWEQEYIEIVVGELYTLNASVLPSKASNKALYYADDGATVDNDGQNYILERKSGDVIMGLNPGESVVTAMSRQDTSKKADITVRVFPEEITLASPTGLTYNTLTNRIEWQPVSYTNGSYTYTPSGYIVKLNGQEQPMTGNTYFDAFESGVVNEISVKAVGTSAAIHDSEYSTEITFKRLNTPTALVRAGNYLIWEGVEEASTYTIRANGVVIETGITETTTVVDFDTEGNYAVTVEAVPDTTNDKTIYSSLPSEAISIVKLNAISELSIHDNAMYWNEVAGAVEYLAVFEIGDDKIIKSAGVNTYIGLNIPELPAGEVQASVIAVNNTTSGFDSENDIKETFTKLGTPNNVQIEDNYLKFSGNDLAVSYSIDVNGEQGDIEVGEFYTLPVNAPAGEYNIKLRANGNGSTTISSNWTSDENVFTAIKLEAPTSVTHTNDTIIVNAQEGVNHYEYKDTEADTNNIYQSGDIVVESNTHIFKMNLIDKVEKMQDIVDNHFTIVVKAKGENGGNYFDSDYSAVSTSFHKLLPPVNFGYSQIEDSDHYQFTWNIFNDDLTTSEDDLSYEANEILSGAVKGYRVNENFQLQPYFHYLFTFTDALGNELYTRTIGVEANESLSLDELTDVGGGQINIAIAIIGNDSRVVTSSYSTALEGRRMYEPQNVVVKDTTLEFTTEGDYEDSEYVVVYVNGEEEKVLGSTTQKTFDLEDLIIEEEPFEFVSGLDYKLRLYAKGTPQENSPYYNSRNTFITIKRLASPVIARSGNYIEWTQIENATGYEVWVDGSKVNAEFETVGNIVRSELISQAGEHSVVVYAISEVENNIFMTSKASNEVEFTRLDVTGLSIENNILSWNKVLDDSSYTLHVLSPTSTGVLKTVTVTELEYDLRLFELVGGAYNICVIASKDNYVDSNKTNYIGVNVLNAPSIIYETAPTNSVISWQAVSNAIGYKLAIKYVVGDDIVTDYTELITKTTFDLSDKQIIGGVMTNITISAIGDGEMNIDSIYFDIENPLDFSKLATPSNIDGTVGEQLYTLTWDAIDGAKYELYLDGTKFGDTDTNSFGIALNTFDQAREYVFNVRAISVTNTKPSSSMSDDFVVTKYSETTGLTVTDNNLSWDYTNNAVYTVRIYNGGQEVAEEVVQTNTFDLTVLDSGTYKAVVVTEGNGKTTISGTATEIDNIVVEEGTNSLSLDSVNKRLTWNAVNNENGYVVVYAQGTTVIRQNATDNFATIPTDVLAGQWVVGVKVAGNGALRVESPLSDTINITKLEKVTNVTYNKGILTFDKVEGFDNYIITKTLEGNTTTISVSYDAQGVAIDLDEVGTYTLGVITVGDYINNVDSNVATIEDVIKLNVVQDLYIDNNILHWADVTGASGYVVKLNNEEYSADTNQFDLTTLNLTKGVYSVSVKATSDEATVLDGEYIALASDITVLGHVTNVTIVDNTIIEFNASNVGNATGYIVVYTGEQVYTEEYEFGDTITINTGLVSDTYAITIISKGDGEFIVNSKPSDGVTIFKPEAPLAVTHKAQNITVTQSGEYQNYIIKITYNNSDSFVEVSAPNLATIYPFEGAGDYAISVAIKGDSSSYISSDYSESITVTRIAPVTGLQVNNNTVTFNHNNIVTANDFEYEIVFDGVQDKVYTTKENTFAFEEELLADTFKIKVKCLAGDDTRYLPSDYTSVNNIIKLQSPVISETLDNNKIVWTSNQTGIVGYELKIVKGQSTSYVSINDANIKEYELNDAYDAGVYTVSVRALGDGITYIRSNFSNEKIVTKLNSPIPVVEKLNNDSTSDYVVRWASVDNATGYNVMVNGAIVFTTELYVSIDNLENVRDGLNTVKVLAVGDTTDYVNSKYSSDVTFMVTDGDSASMRISQGRLVWGNISGAVLYVLDINGVKVNVGNVNEYSLGTDFNAGEYQIKLKAYMNSTSGTSNVLVNSSYSEVVQGYKLVRPASPAIKFGLFELFEVQYRLPAVEEGEEDEAIIKYFEYQYGNAHNVIEVNLSDELESQGYQIYSNRVGIKSNFRYRAVGDNMNFTSDWSDAITPTYGEQLPAPQNISMSNGLLMWDKVDNALGYVIIGGYSKYNEDGELEVNQYEIITDKTSYTKPFAELLEDENISVQVGIIALGDSYYTCSSLSQTRQITYLAKPTNFQTNLGELTWEGGYRSFEITIDNAIVKTLNATNVYDFSSEASGKRSFKVKALGDGAFIVDSEYSDTYSVYKLGTPEKAVFDTYVEDGKLRWCTNTSFILGLTNSMLTTFPPIGDVRIYSYYNGVLEDTLPGENEEEKRLNVFNVFDLCTVDVQSSYFTSHLLTYFDSLEAGAYTFKVANLGNTIPLKNGVGYITSNYSVEFNVEILKVTNNIYIEDGVLYWDNVDNNNGYELFVDCGEEQILIGLVLAEDVNSIDLLSLGLPPDTYSVYVRTRGDSTMYLTSNTSESLTTTVLEVPTAGEFPFTIIDGKLSWGQVKGASGYFVEVINIENNESFYFENIEFEDNNGVITYRLPDSLNAGEYNVCIKALGDGVEFLDSEFGEYSKVIKLDALNRIGNTLGKLTWEIAYFDNGASVDRYELEFVSINNVDRYNYIISKENGDFITDDDYCYYELHNEIQQGTYRITIRPVGEVLVDNNVRTLYASGSASYTLEATRLSAPNEVYVDAGIIKWNYVGSGHSGFYLVVNNTTYEDKLITVQQTEFRDEISSDKHNLAIKVVGNTVPYNENGVRLLTSSAIGSELVIEKLQEVSGIFIYNGIIYFNGVDNASAYEVVARYGDTNITARTTSYDTDLGMYYFEMIGNNYPQGEYSRVSIRAIGDSHFVNSKYKDLVYSHEGDTYKNVFKLSTPSQVELSVDEFEYLTLKWQGVEYEFDNRTIITTKYRIKLVGENNFIRYYDFEVNSSNVIPDIVGTTHYQINLNELFMSLMEGTYKISMQAIPLPYAEDNFNALSSEFTTEIQITKPDTPSNLKFDTDLRAYTWDAPLVDSAVHLQYEVFYMYKSAVNSVNELGKVVVDKPIFYPAELGIYSVAVRAIVSNSLASSYIGLNGKDPYLLIKMSDSSVEEEWYNFDKIEFEDNKYYLGDVEFTVINMFNGVNGTHDLFAGGNGSVTNPYKISTAEQFGRISYYYTNDFYFVQTANINFAGTVYKVGSKAKPFSGAYDGAGYTISGFNITANEENVGLFVATNGATIQNINVINSTISVGRIERTNIGFIVGYATSTRIINTTVTASNINITFASSNSITYNVGGIVGYAIGSGSLIKDCYNASNIVRVNNSTTLTMYSGGIAGYISTTNDNNLGIINCGNAGNIQGTIVGGLSGSAECVISNSYNLGTVTGTYAENMAPSAGGIVGRMIGSGGTRYIVNNCYNVGQVTCKAKVNGTSYAGGLAGNSNSYVFNFYNNGEVSASSTGASSSGNQFYGWLMGAASGNVTISNVYTTITTLVNPFGNGNYTGSFEVLTMEVLGNDVANKLGDAFEYSTVKGRVILKIEN